MDLSNKKVIVIGAGISGFAAAKLAKKLGADVILSDANEKLGEKHDLTELTALDIKVVLGKQTEALFEGSDLVIISPAVPRHLPLFEKVAEIEKHHEDNPGDIISVIVKVADAISSSRPGARHDSFEQYVQRLEELEKIATSFEGVEKVYAIQAGREVRIVVKPEQISDADMTILARDVAKKVEEEMEYPGQIKVNIIRETRVVDYAK